MKRSRPPRPRVKLNRDAAWELLDRLGMSRKNPARRSGLSSEYLSQLMNGKSNPSPYARRRLQQTLGVEGLGRRLHRQAAGKRGGGGLHIWSTRERLRSQRFEAGGTGNRRLQSRPEPKGPTEPSGEEGVPMDRPRRAALYARALTDDPEDGLSWDNQLSRLREYAEILGVEVYAESMWTSAPPHGRTAPVPGNVERGHRPGTALRHRAGP